METCKCGCGGKVREGRTFLPGHYQKWKKKPRKIEMNSGGLRFCIMKEGMMADNRNIRKEEKITEVLDSEISLEDMIKNAKVEIPSTKSSVPLRPSMAPDITDRNNSVLTGELARSQDPDRKPADQGMKLWQIILLLISVFLVTFGSIAHFLGVA